MSSAQDAEKTVETALVLVDTSVWVEFFRNSDSLPAQRLDVLLNIGPVATCDPIRAEVVSGAPTQKEFERLGRLFSALISLPAPKDVWRQIEKARFALARKGHQASLVDLSIAITAQAHNAPLWTLDQDFAAIAGVVGFSAYSFGAD